MKRLLIPAAALSASMLLCATALGSAGGQLQSVNCTNVITGDGGTSNIVSWPTNATYNTGLSTGGPVYVGNVDHFGLCVQGFQVSTNITTNAAVMVALVTSMSQSTPVVTTGTNAYSSVTSTVTRNDWQVSTPPYIVTFSFPTNSGTNWFNFQTNIPTSVLGSEVNWVGVYQITNSMLAGGLVTNFSVGINTKLLPNPID